MMNLAVTLGDNLGVKLVIGMIAWFAQMGFHEGGHAWAAYKLGDNTAYHMGKRTVNPFAHVDWKNPFSVGAAVVMPAITAVTWGFPLGMAWVPVNPGNFRHPLRDHALVAFAGPLGGFVVALIFFAIYFAVYPILNMGGEQTAGQTVLFSLLFLTYLTAIVYSIFNLIPIPPLDGSNILYYFGNESLRTLMDKVRPYGFFIIILVFWVAGGGVIIQPAIDAMFWPFANLPPMVWG